MSKSIASGVGYIVISLLFLLNSVGAQAQAQAQPSSNAHNAAEASRGDTLGAHDAIRVVVRSSSGLPLCQSFSFSEVPQSSDLFVGKLKTSTDKGVCAGHQTLALFRMDWRTHVMTLQQMLLNVPLKTRAGTIADAYDPYVAKFGNETWVAFECVGPGIAGTSACMAPFVRDKNTIDQKRLSIPVVGISSNDSSPWRYSASTPKLLDFKHKFYLYWTAIRYSKAPPYRWNDIETRGAQVDIDGDGAGRLWVKGSIGRSVPSYAPGSNIAVMVPRKADPYSNTAVDTEGLYVAGDHIIVLSSVGGAGPDGRSRCTKPLDKSPGCFRLQINRTTHPLGHDAFGEEIFVPPPQLPANPTEYPRLVTAPGGATYLMVNSHPMQAAASPNSGDAIGAGLLLIPLPLNSLHFKHMNRNGGSGN